MKSNTTNYLIIVESPAKCKKIEEYLGKGYKCVATYGHLRELKNLDDISINLNENKVDVKIKYHNVPSKSKTISFLKNQIASCDIVVLATDSDREGEAIAWHICDMFGLPTKTTPRMIFTEITKSAIQLAAENTGVLNMALVNAQKARQLLDIWIGFKVSPLLWQYLQTPRDEKNKTGLSAGRCQTPALRLVCDNQTNVQKSWQNSTYQYDTHGYFGRKNVKFILATTLPKICVAEFLKRSQTHKHLYSMQKRSLSHHSPPEPFTTSRLQQTANNRLRLSPKDTMRSAQTLYEKGLITYMRTDCKVYSDAFLLEAKNYISNTWSENHYQDTKSDAKTPKQSKTQIKKTVMAQEAHEAIRPTNLSIQPKNLKALDQTLTGKEQRLYEMIWTNTLESCMTAARGEIILAHLSAPSVYSSDNENIDTQTPIHYYAKIERIIFLGWMAVRGYDHASPDNNNTPNIDNIDNTSEYTSTETFSYIESLTNNQEIPYNSILSLVKLHGLTQHVTESKLVRILEQHGIGRPSTFATLIDKLIERKYVKIDSIEGIKQNVIEYRLDRGSPLVEETRERIYGAEKNKMIVQSLGNAVNEYLSQEVNELFSYDFTKYMEDRLDEIAHSHVDWKDVCIAYLNQIEKITNHANDKGKTLKIATKNNRSLGEYNGAPLYLCIGRYGYYAKWGDETSQKLSLPNISSHTPIECISNDQVIAMLNQENEKKLSLRNEETSEFRHLTDHLSVRKGKYGSYVFYKKPNMSKPTFLNLKKFKHNPWTCDSTIIMTWLTNEYMV